MARDGAYLAGANIDGWHAKSLRGDDAEGLRQWRDTDLVTFLKTGRTDRTAAFANMADVVHHSTQYLTDSDLGTIAYYLKSLSPEGRSATVAPAAADGATWDAFRAGGRPELGAATYGEFCISCHRTDGLGVARIFPTLAGNSVVTTLDPTLADFISCWPEGGRRKPMRRLRPMRCPPSISLATRRSPTS